MPTNTEIQELIDSGFIIRFDDGNIVITHWLVHNRIKQSRITPTICTQDRALLLPRWDKSCGTVPPSEPYVLIKETIGIPSDGHMTDTCPTNGDQLPPQIRGGEDRLEEDRLGEIKNSSEQKTSSELVPPPNPDECIEFPVLGGSTSIPKSLIEEWESVYTNVDVMQEVLKAKEWCKANPKRLKVNWRSFLVNWLNKNQDRRPMPEEGYRTPGPNRCMEPDKVIETEEAGF